MFDNFSNAISLYLSLQNSGVKSSGRGRPLHRVSMEEIYGACVVEWLGRKPAGYWGARSTIGACAGPKSCRAKNEFIAGLPRLLDRLTGEGKLQRRIAKGESGCFEDQYSVYTTEAVV